MNIVLKLYILLFLYITATITTVTIESENKALISRYLHSTLLRSAVKVTSVCRTLSILPVPLNSF